ncbi:MAG: tetratricopeptide repeat protein [Bacteroidetes bacterium]|nr:tetratricopeptide repeat protein [Bacteroidota bacterium]MCY4205423.1 tetratricopeptide repeat protein [Bacteroidota bacterium]
MRFFPIHLLVFTFLAGSVSAQPQRADRTAQLSEEESLEGTDASRYQLALSYIRGMQFDQAIAVLRELHVEYPERPIFFEKLKEAYVNTKEYENAIKLLDEEILRRDEEQRPVLEAERAQLLYLSGDEPAAMKAWYAMVESAFSTETAYRIAYNSMIQVRLLVQAIDLLINGRQKIGNQHLFQVEVAYLYNLTGQHELATQEYLDLLALNDRQLNYVKGRLARDLQQDGALESAIRVTQKYISIEPELQQFRNLLAWLYEENGDFELAYNELLFLETEAEASGHGIFQFALRAAEAGAYSTAGKAFQNVLGTYPEEDISVEARLGIATMYRLQGERSAQPSEYYQMALEAYENFLSDFPEHHQTPSVMAQIAHLYQDIFRNRDSARYVLSKLATEYADSPVGHQAQFDLGRLAIEEGNLDRAKEIFSQLSDHAEGELSAHAKFEEALIYFYSGKFEITQSLLNSSIRQSTDKEIANDAIALRVLLLENPPLDSTNQALMSYAKARLLLRQHKIDETVKASQDILSHWGQYPIADETQFLLAEALLINKQFDEALVVFEEFSRLHPQSPLRDHSLFYYAEILETVRGDTAKALQAYNDFLIQFPGSLLVGKVRERIWALRDSSM